jgi:hypothetical protein
MVNWRCRFQVWGDKTKNGFAKQSQSFSFDRSRREAQFGQDLEAKGFADYRLKGHVYLAGLTRYAKLPTIWPARQFCQEIGPVRWDMSTEAVDQAAKPIDDRLGNTYFPINRFREIGQDFIFLLLLIIATIPLRIWQIDTTEVAARDSIGYIRIAWQLRLRPWNEVVKTADQHPGYPVALLAMSAPVRLFMDAPESLVMQRSAQLTSVLFGLLLIAPMFYLGKELFSRSVGFWAAAFFQVVPAGSRVLADGLSEGAFLFFAVSAMLLASWALRKRSALLFGITGVLSGFAYLIRPEGALVAAVAGLVLIMIQFMKPWRFQRPLLVQSGVCLALGWLVVAGPYMAAIDGFTVKLSSKFIVDPSLKVDQPLGKEITSNMTADSSSFVLVHASRVSPSSPLFAVWLSDTESSKVTTGLKAVGFEIAKGFGFIAWIPALLGMWWNRSILRTRPGSWILLLVSVLLFLLLWRLATVVGYVSERHTILLILCGCFPAVAASITIGNKVNIWASTWYTKLISKANSASPRQLLNNQLCAALFPLALIASVLPKDFEPLHANRSGFRDAGLWLAQHALPSDEIRDPYCWAHYYAGRVFQEGMTQDDPAGKQAICYVVLELSGNSHLRLKEIPAAKLLAAQGQLVYEWEGTRKKDHCIVCVYACPKPDVGKERAQVAHTVANAVEASSSGTPWEKTHR